MIKVLMACFIIATIFGGIALIINTLFSGFRYMRRGRGKISKEEDIAETRMIQEMYQGLTKMESRMEALETILMEEQGKERKK